MNPRDHINAPRETSSLLPKRDSTSPNHLWRSVAQGGHTLSALVNSQSVVNAKLNGISGNTQASMGFRPWMVYPYVKGTIPQSAETQLGITDENISRCFRVRSGSINNYPGPSIDGLISFQYQYEMGSAVGCDLRRTFGSGLIPLASDDLTNGSEYTSGQQEDFARSIFILPKDKITYFYLYTHDATTLKLCVTDDPKNAAPPDGVPHKWSNFPNYHPAFTPLAWVATSANGNNIYQMLWGNVDPENHLMSYKTWGYRPSPDITSLNAFGYPKGALVTKARGPYKTAAYFSAVGGNKVNPDSDNGAWVRLGEYLTTQVDPGPVANLSLAGLPDQTAINNAIVSKINEILVNLRAQKVITP